MKNAVEREIVHEEEEEDDAEGWPLAYVSDLSPLSSPTASPMSSRPSSPSAAPSLTSEHATPTPPVQQSQQSASGQRISHKKAGYKKRRQRWRTEAQANGEYDKKIRKTQSQRYHALSTIKTSFNAQKLPVTRQGFIGKRFDVDAHHRDLQSYVDEGFKVVEWDGMCVLMISSLRRSHGPLSIRTTLGITDKDGRVICVFAGGPSGDASWSGVVQGAQVAMADAKRRLRFSGKRDRRGEFQTIAMGLSYGGGQMVRHHISIFN